MSKFCIKCGEALVKGASFCGSCGCAVVSPHTAVSGSSYLQATNASMQSMWHYIKDDQEIGPVDQSGAQNLIQAEEIQPDTYVWREGMDEWKFASETELRGLFPRVEPPSIPTSGHSTFREGEKASTRGSAISEKVRKMNSWFTTFWISLAIGTPLLFFGIGIIGFLVAGVFYFLIIYNLWALIPKDAARTTPGKAVGFSLIPFFNLYWNFIAFYELSKALNVETTKRSIPNVRIEEGLSLTYCIFACVLIIPEPLILVIFSLLAMILLLFVLKQMKDAGIALLEYTETQRSTPEVC